MLEFYLLMIIILIAILTFLMNHYNRRQADALNTTARVAVDWLILEIRRTREERKDNLVITKPLAWIATHANMEILRKDRIFEEFAAVEFSTTAGKLVVSSLDPTDIKTALKKFRSHRWTSKAIKANNIPLLPVNWMGAIKAEVHSVSLQDYQWFDIEAEQVGKLLNMEWGVVDRLWFYDVEN